MNQLQIRQLAAMFSDVGVVILASVVLPSVFGTIITSNVIAGSITSLILWFISIWILRNLN